MATGTGTAPRPHHPTAREWGEALGEHSAELHRLLEIARDDTSDEAAVWHAIESMGGPLHQLRCIVADMLGEPRPT